MSDPWSREHHYPTSRGRHRPADHHNSRSREVGTRTWEGSSSSSSPEPQREATSSSYWEADVDVEDAPVEDVPAVTGATVRVVCKANFDYSLTVRNNEVVLAPARASDDRQLWIKDNHWSTRVRDEGGHPAFALINKTTGLALQHALSEGKQVRLAEYAQENLEESVLWTLSDDIQEGYTAVRPASNVKQNLDAWHATPENGGVHDGTVICLYKWNKQPNQLWKLVAT